ncbi:hypothetical protein [Methyloprofundus sp.]|uniref:hypothetical protein n=1 Tax=Methyloprofundus sp. TaxID=2020875 RepID=UPI003D0B0A99
MNILFKQWIKLILSLLILSITGISRAAPVIAEQILLANGGDSVAISEEWGFVGDTDECEVAVYKYDYSTNLWGDGAGNAGDKHSTIDEGPCTNAKFRSFGASVSTTKGLLVVGAPEAKDTGGAFHGKIFFYNLISDAWVLNTTAGSPEDPAGTPDLQNDALFGFVVSIRSEGNVALMLIGSPGYDVGGGMLMLGRFIFIPGISPTAP